MQQLKIALQQFGALRPGAWSHLLANCEHVLLQENENFIRETGGTAFVVSGLLKEYDSRFRKKPSIINFISENQFFVTRKHNQVNFIKACRPSLVYFIQAEKQKFVYKSFKELAKLHALLEEEYEHKLAFRQIILEERLSARRIAMFIETYRHILPHLKKKDVANYLHVEYNRFIRQYSKML